jgi:hypothetical protein
MSIPVGHQRDLPSYIYHAKMFISQSTHFTMVQTRHKAGLPRCIAGCPTHARRAPRRQRKHSRLSSFTHQQFLQHFWFSRYCVLLRVSKDAVRDLWYAPTISNTPTH